MSSQQKPTKLAEVGKPIVDYPVNSSNGNTVSFSEFLGKKIVLYFYPKDNTPGCTIESNEFNDLHEEFVKNGAVILGVSRDSVASHCKFIDKFGFKFDLLSDNEELLCRYFDVIKPKNMYGKTVIGIERSTFIIDEKGILSHAFRKVKAEGHATSILDTVKKM